MLARLAVLTATASLALVAAAPALANEPFWTQPPGLSLQGSQLVGSNGGWASYSGPVTRYVFRFLRDGVSVKGPVDPVPKNTPGTAPLPAGTYPDDPNANVYSLGAADAGHCFVLEVWGGIHSVYYRTDGTLAYDAWEWGHLDTFGNPAVSTQVCVPGAAPPPPGPTPPPPPQIPQLAFVDTSLQAGTMGIAYTRQLSVRNGTAPSFSLASGTLPDGVTLSGSGLLTGIPTKAGTFDFTVRATDPVATGASQSFSLQIVAPELAINPQQLFPATPGIFYSQPISASGGSAPYTFALSGGALPVGLTLGSDGVLRGIAHDAPGLFTFTVHAADQFGATGSKTFTLQLTTPTIYVASLALPSATVGSAYNQALVVFGGSTPYRFTVVDGSLPSGMKLSADGVLAGVPATAGTYLFTVGITDANGVSITQSFRLVVEKAPPTVTKKKPPKKKPKSRNP
jgi:hypothetical protein